MVALLGVLFLGDLPGGVKSRDCEYAFKPVSVRLGLIVTFGEEYLHRTFGGWFRIGRHYEPDRQCASYKKCFSWFSDKRASLDK